MYEHKKSASEQKKTLLKARLSIKTKSTQLSAYWYPILENINQAEIPWELAYLDCAIGPEFDCWQGELKENPWNKFGLSPKVILEREDLYLQETVFSTYPGTLPLRYLPEPGYQLNQPQETIQETLKKCLSLLDLPEQPVYFFLGRFSPVMILSLSDLLQLANETVFPFFEDVCVTSLHSDWLIFRSMEDEWRFGYLNKI